MSLSALHQEVRDIAKEISETNGVEVYARLEVWELCKKKLSSLRWIKRIDENTIVTVNDSRIIWP